MKAISDLIQEIKNCELAGATMAAVTLCYVCIDTMAFLSMPESQDNTTKTDFIGWVDAHLKSHPNQHYEYRGVDVYAARCAVLHTWGAEADAHRKDPTIRQFGRGRKSSARIKAKRCRSPVERRSMGQPREDGGSLNASTSDSALDQSGKCAPTVSAHQPGSAGT